MANYHDFHPDYYPGQDPMQEARLNALLHTQYGGAHGGPPKAKGIFVPGLHRRRLNALPILYAILLPWGIFALIFGITSFKIKYDSPLLYWFIVLGCLGVVLIFMILAVDATRKKQKGNPLREPTWLIFVFVCCLVMWCGAMLAGNANYSMNTRPYYDHEGLGTYHDVNPTRMNGGQLMDSGKVEFSADSHIDLTKAMGFRNIDTYCVAPVVAPLPDKSSSKLETYDFWAVGKGCCLEDHENTEMVGYHCGQFNSPRAHAGLRLMDDADRPFYRLAVQQAEAAYGIQAKHPLFYIWLQDPAADILGRYLQGEKYFHMGIASALIVQMFVVAATTLAFARLGKM